MLKPRGLNSTASLVLWRYTTRRRCQADWKRRYVYAVLQSIRDCEHRCFPTDASSELPSLQEGRSYFNPCEFQGHLYICGGRARSIEVFDIHSRNFLPVTAQLPDATQCVALVDNGELVVFSQICVSRWRTGQGHQLEQLSQSQHTCQQLGSCMLPCVDAVNGTVYLVEQDQRYSFSLR